VNTSRSLTQVRSAGRGIQLARRQHDLPVLAVDLIAIVVDRDEVVVGADLLDLSERLEQRLVIPEAHVIERGAVVLDVLLRERRFALQLALFDAIERVGLARRGDVVFHERRFVDLLVRRHREALQQARVPFAAEQHQRIQRRAGDHVTGRPVIAVAADNPAATIDASTSASAAGMRPCTSAYDAPWMMPDGDTIS
jgi:hypothetical protein